MDKIQKITPFLWFDNQAEEAVNFYISVFKNYSSPVGLSEVKTVVRYGDAGPGKKGSVMTIAFNLEGQEFTAINGGPMFNFTPAISLVIKCKTQEEVDYYWEKLSEGGYDPAQQCGWLQDKYGLSWQIVPVALIEMLNDPDPEKSSSVMQAMLQMKKIEINKLKKAYENG
jgi:predicted 3-demethylubiquinone-9 3-methyltransferase (glyoxalase superfamily)